MLKFKRPITCLLSLLLVFSMLGTNAFASSDSDTLNNLLRDEITSCMGSVVPGGGFIAPIVGSMWPSNDVDIFTLIKQQTQDLIDQNIVDYALNNSTCNLNVAKTYFNRYIDTRRSKAERADALKGALFQLEQLKSNLISNYKTSYRVMIPLMTSIAILHMSAYKELYYNGTTMVYPEGNPEIWKSDMIDAYNDYFNYMKTAYSQWKAWRTGLITYEYNAQAYSVGYKTYAWSWGKVTDTFTGKALYSESLNNNIDINHFKNITLANKAVADINVLKELDTELDVMAKLHNAIPGMESQGSKINDITKKSYLATNEYLKTNEYIVSPSGNCFAIMQGDGNFVVYKGSGPADNKGFVWATRSNQSSGNGQYFAIMQGDGNFVIYKGTGPSDNKGFLWASWSQGNGNCFFTVDDMVGLGINKGTDPNSFTGVAKRLY